MFEEFPRIQDTKKWAKDSKRKLQSLIEVDFYNDKSQAWHATQWIEGLPEKTLLIHEKKSTKASLAGKNVAWDKVFKSIQHENFQEIWVNCLKIIC